MKIGYDFHHELGIDLVDYASGERAWSEFYDFLQELPEHGKFKSAVALDMDFAREMKRRLDEDRDRLEELDEDDPDIIQKDNSLRSPEGYSPTMSILFTIEERLQALTAVTLGAAGVKSPPDVRFNKRPFVALQVLDLEEERDEMADLKRAFKIR